MPRPYAKDQLDFAKVPDPQVPVFVTANKTLLKHIKPVSGQPLTFRTKDLGQPNEVTLIPYYKVSDERYSIYWNVVSPADWKAKSPPATVAPEHI